MVSRNRLRLILALFLVLPLSGKAFSLLGPYAPWMTFELGYQQDGDLELGGPMDLGEEYRWNIPVVTYGFDPSFLTYFGSNGVSEVEKAIAILNDLPPASAMNPLAFPNIPRAPLNFTGQSLRIFDLKSASLSALVKTLGLTSPERYLWTLRSRFVSGGTTNYLVIQRNFDPLLLTPSGVVNGSLFTYRIFDQVLPFTPSASDAVEHLVDSLASRFSSVAGFAMCNWSYCNGAPGEIVTGLSADDAGGLRYIYSPQNINVETLPSGVTDLSGRTAFVNAAYRPGVDKLTFVKMPFTTDLALVSPMTNTFSDVYLSNGILSTQIVQRVQSRPDIIFSTQRKAAIGDLPP